MKIPKAEHTKEFSLLLRLPTTYLTCGRGLAHKVALIPNGSRAEVRIGDGECHRHLREEFTTDEKRESLLEKTRNAYQRLIEWPRGLKRVNRADGLTLIEMV